MNQNRKRLEMAGYNRRKVHPSVSEASDRSIKLSQQVVDDFVVRLVADVVDVLVSNFAFFVHDEQRALRVSFGAVGAILASHFAFRFKVGKEIVGDAAEALGPGSVAGDGVYGYTQHVGIALLESAEVSLIRGHLNGSYGCPGQRVERDEDVLLAAKV